MLRLLVFCSLIVVAAGFFLYSCSRLIKALSLGKPQRRSDNIPARLWNVLTVAFGQSKLLRDPVAGIMHFFIFWGFMILLSAVVEAVIQGIAPEFSLTMLGPLFPPLAALQETIGALVILSCLFALTRWFLFPPARFFGREITGPVRLDAALVLVLILIIMASMFVTYSASAAASSEIAPARFISNRLAGLFSSDGADAWLRLFWWTHLVVILGFLNYLPYSKHLHIITSIPNVFLASLKPRGQLSGLDFEDETAESYGAADVQDLTWKQLLDGFTCTDCGRCTAACPASITGKPLSPRKIIMNIRQRTTELNRDGTDELTGHRLVDSFISEQELWDCTTCRACMEECPVMIEHVPAIMEMRRWLVLTESRFPQELTTAYKSLETSFNPWGFSPESRGDWAKGLNVRTIAEAGGKCDVLYWVGCAGSYDSRYQKVSRAMAALLNAAGVDFAILGKEEKCNGDPARRSGNEYLAQMLITENVETLNRYSFNRIVTTCPHCFNTLKNEYPGFGAAYQVLHHTEFLWQLIRSSKLRLSANRSRTVFHDSCYIGRYNAIYDIPRHLISGSGADLLEMKRSRSRGLCCGAGGARMFMEEKIGKRINLERTEEAMSLRPEVIASECPFCMTMLSDGVKALDSEERIQVRDIAEILADGLETETPDRNS